MKNQNQISFPALASRLQVHSTSVYSGKGKQRLWNHWMLLTFTLILQVPGFTPVNAQLLQWNTFGNAGTETTEPSVFNATGIAAANLTQGAITPAGNGNRFGGSNWFDTGDTNPTTLAESVSGNDYLEFTVTPVPGATYTPTSFDFVWDRSGTGPSSVTLRSSADGYTSDLGTVAGIVSGDFAMNNISISGLTNLTTATTFRLYGYAGIAAAGTGGFDNTTNDVNVTLQGTSVCNVMNITAVSCHTTLQAAINAANPGDVLELTGNLSEGQVTVNKAVTIDGNGFTLTSTSGNYGVEVDDQNVTIQDLTIVDAGTIGLQINCSSDNLVLTNVTVNSSGNSGVGLNGSNNVVITNLTSTNNTGNGISITDCDNLTINGITTSGNMFGGGFNAGIGLFTSGVYCPPAGINGFTLTGTVSIAEQTKVYSQKANAAHVITGLSGSSIAWAVGIGPLDRNYWPDKATCYAVVDALFEPPFSYSNTLIYVAEIATENFYVEDDPNGDATPPMLIQTAVTYEVPGKTIFLESGTYSERVTLNKSLTLDGAGAGSSVLDGTGLAGTGSGVTLNNGITNVTIKDLTVRDYAGAGPNSFAGIYAIGGNNNLTVTDVDLADNIGGSGFYANGPIDNVLLNNVDAHGHTNVSGAARGIVIWNGHKSNITITNCEVYNNNCCGIELQDGSSSAVNISDNYVHDNTDNGIGLVGMDGTTGSNLVEDNTVVDNGRFGIEIKNPNGNGSNIVINSNDVSRTLAIADLRDIAGIAVFRRSVTGSNTDVPKGVTVTNNNVSGYVQPSNSDGFGIVVEGISHTITGNNVTGNDVGIQQQAGHTPYPGDGDQSNLADTYFGRGNSPMTCSNTVTPNTLSSNGVNTRNISVGGGLVTNTTTSEIFCSIQSAINDANTTAGHTLSVAAGTYNEDVTVNKSVVVSGAGIDQSYVTGPIGGGGSTFQVSASGVVIEGFTISREGNNTTDWNNPNLNIPGIAIQGQSVDAEIRNNKITGNRTGIDVNNSNDNNIHNNIITFNRTGLIFRNQTDNTLLNENEITDNWTVGVVFLDASGGTNVPVQTAINCSFNDNDISGNWYGQIVDRQTGGALPPPGSNLKNFECNWYGTVSPWVSTANSTEPGYSAQIPVAYGGSAVPPGGQPDILGPASANFDYISYLVDGTDSNIGETGFQPAIGACTGSPVVVSATATPETCAGGNGTIQVTFIGGTPDYSISWAGPDPGSDGMVTSPYNIGSLSAGAYTITVTDDNGTTGTATANVLYHPVENTTQSSTYATIQAAINAATAGDDIYICNGTYTEDVDVNKQNLTITGQSRSGVVIRGLYTAGGVATLKFANTSADGAVVSNLTVSRDYQDWYGSTKNYGVLLSGGVNNVTLDNVHVRDNRNGVYVENNGQLNMSNCLIEQNRTGIHITNTVRGSVSNNIVRDNQTHGVFYNLNDGTSNLSNFTLFDNNFYGNWYSEVTFRGVNTLAPQADFECNWFGSDAPVVNATDPSELGYASLIPQQLGGTSAQATYNGALRGNGAIYIDYETWRTGESGNTSDPFVPVGMCDGTPVVIVSATADNIECGEASGSITVTFSGGSPDYNLSWSGPSAGSAMAVTSPHVIPALPAGAYSITITDDNGSTDVEVATVLSLPVTNVTQSTNHATIGDAIDDATSGDVLELCAGTYLETVVVDKSLTILGPNEAVSGCDMRGAEAIIMPPASQPFYDGTTEVRLMQIEANNVTVRGITFDGDNPGITMNSDGGPIDAADGIDVYSDVSGIVIENNIFKNLNEGGATGYPSGSLSLTGNTISNNKFENIPGLVGTGYPNSGYGIAVLIYNNFYSNVEDNCMDDVRIGIQTENYNLSDAGTSRSITNNTIDFNILGIWHNLAYQNASEFDITNNTLTTSNNTTSSGLFVSSLQGAVGVDITDNDITGAFAGVELWNNPTSNTVTVNGGTISNCVKGVFANNYDGYTSDAATSAYAIDDVTITGGTTGIHVKDNSSNSNVALVSVQIQNGTAISGAPTGLLLEGAGASASFSGATPALFTGQTLYIDQITNGTDAPGTDIDATAVLFDGQTGLTATHPQLFAIEDKINHTIDWNTLGFVTVKASNTHVTDAVSATATNNDYTRLRNAIELIGNGWAMNLEGDFDWTESNAAAAWALGNDGVVTPADDYSIIVPANLNGVTLTAPSGPGTATIEGPGDLAAINLEGVFFFDGGDNQNWTISDLVFDDFDLALGFFNGAGGVDAFNNTSIIGNTFNIATDLNIVDAPADVNQNIGLHYSFGTNQTISNNTFNIAGDGVSNGLNTSASVGMQSNTSGGSAYDGLLINGNIINIQNAQSANPQVVLGIWENGHAHTSDITVSNNQFNNLAGGNDPALNLQRGFRVTSHSGATTTVAYNGNNVNGASTGFQWIAGSNFAAHQPVQMSGNTITDNSIGILLQSNGKANLVNTDFDGADDNARDLQIQAGSVATTGGGNQWAGEGYYVENLGSAALNVTGETFDQANPYRRTDRMYDALDNGASGLVRFDGSNLYVSAPGTGLSDETIQAAINAATNAVDAVNIETGSYTTGADASAKDVAFAPGSSPGCVTLGGDLVLTSGDDLEIEINGTTPCTTHDQLTVNGMVFLGGANLDATLGYVPSNGDNIVIIENDSNDPVNGTFAQGSSITIGGNYFLINYGGGDGNDVVLTLCAGVLNTTTLEVFCTIQEGVNDPQTLNGHTLQIQAGTYNERVTLTKQLTLDGAGAGLTVLDGTGLAGTGNGITINSGITNVTIKDLTVRDYAGANPNTNAGIHGVAGNNNLTITDVDLADNIGGSGFYANGPIDNVLMNNVDAHGHTNVNGAARGIVIWNGHKSNITITNCEVYDNNCCGIELQDGSSSAVNISNNNVHDNWDNGIGLVGLDNTTGNNLVDLNMVEDNGRFGIEIKNPNGNGTNTVVSNNTVLISSSFVGQRPSEVRDIAGIAVFRRSVTGSNVDVPNGVRVINNNVSGYIQDNGASVSEGFGIVIEGTNHTVTGNTINGNDVGLQQQSGHTPYPGDGNQNNVADTYFGRGNSPMTCANTTSPNTFVSNGLNTRDIFVGGGLVTNTNTMETYCSLQSAINDANIYDVLTVGPGTYNENVTVNKSLTITGAGNGSNPATNSVLAPSVACSGVGFTIAASNVTIQNFYVTGYQDAVVVSGVSDLVLDDLALIDYCRYGISLAGASNTNIDITNTTIQRTTYLASTVGVRAGTATSVSDLLLDGCTVEGNTQGFFIAQATTPSLFDNIIIQNSSISNNLQKGLYFEKLSNALLTNLTMDNNGTDPAYGFNNGIDINLKYDDYANITISNCDITNSGANGTAADPQNAAAVTIKARDDMPSYNTIPASLDGVVVENNRITGPQNGIRFGEFGKINEGPSNVTLEGNDLSYSFAHKAIIRRTNDNVNLVCNWHGSTSLPTILAGIADAGTGSTILSSILTTGGDGNLAVGFQPSGTCGCPGGNLVTNTNSTETFCTLQAAIDDADTDPNDVLVMNAGTYIENIYLTKPLDIRGNNYGISPNTGSRIAETVIMPYYSDPDPNSATASVILYMNADASGTMIDGILFEGDNPGLTSAVNINGANIDAIEAIAGYEGTGELQVRNNIIRNLSYSGIDMYNYYNSGGVTSDNYITDNKIDNIAQSPYGIGVLIYNNFYAAVEDNVITRVRVGVQTGNFYSANSSTTNSISNNAIESERRGIFHNLSYGSASSFDIEDNTITTVSGALNHLGISLSSLGGTVGANVSGNDVDGAYAGVDFWSCTATPAITVSGGSITDCNYGVVASNYDGYNSNANSGTARISGVSITGSSVAAVHVKDNPLNSNGATISLTIDSNCEINGTGLLTGVLVTGPQASANITGNNASINGFAIGIDVDGSSATITNNHIYDNGIGIRFTNGGTGNANTNNFFDALPNDTDIEITSSGGSVVATPNNWFAGSVVGVNNASALPVDASGSYWDDPSGPGPVGPGNGANVSTNVLYCPWLGDAPVAFSGTGAPSTSPDVTIVVTETSGTTNNDGTICNGASATLNATSLSALSYAWSTSETTPSIIVSPATNTMYTVTVTFAGCDVTETVTITVNPLPIVSGPSAVCVGSMIQMMPSSGGTWMSSNPLVASIDGSGLVTGMAPGSVTFTFTDGTTGCSNTTGTVTVNPLPVSTITSPEFAWENTGGYTASVPDAGIGAVYNWALSSGSISGGSGTNTISITTGVAGTLMINITVTDANGCSSASAESIEVLPACLEIDFSDPVLLSNTPLLGYWYTDRYNPEVFEGEANAPDATPDVLHEEINAADGQSDPFYNTQGRKHDVIDGSQAIQANLYIPASWASTNRRMAGMWGTAQDAGNATSAYPIIEFTSDGGIPRFRIWESGSGVWVNLGLPPGFVYNNWVTLRSQLLGSGEFLHTVTTNQGTLQYTTTTSSGDASVDIVNIILQGHNTTAGVTYDIHWDNVMSSTILTPTITAPAEVCSGNTGYNASVTAYGGASYTWTVVGGTLTSSDDTPNITFDAGTGTQMTLTVLIQTADCEITTSEVIVINPLPNATITTAPVVVTGTPNNPASIPDAGGGASYMWSITNGTITNGGMTSSILYTAGVVGPLTINVTVTDANGCSSTGTANVNVISVGPSSLQWVPDNAAHGSCGATTNCCTDIICYGLEYTPGVTGNLTSYTTGFITNCLGGFPSGLTPVSSNMSCVMNNNSFEINGCALIDSVLFNSSGNSGLVPVVAGTPIIIHKVCFNLSAGDVIGIREDQVTNLSASVDLTGGGQYTEFPMYTTTSLSKPLPVIPGNGVATVSCPSQATTPTPPPVVDYCGNPVPATLLTTIDAPNPVTCEGTRTYNFQYQDCAGQTYPWTFTYTIDRVTPPSEVGGPVSDNGGTVQCVASATAPGILPVVQDVCGNVLSPTGPPAIGGTYAGCEGTYSYTYNYVDCSGLPFSWTYTYTIDRTTAPGEVGGPVSNNGGVVQCVASAIAPGTLPVVQDVCGMVLSPTGPPTIGGTYAGCEGTYTFTYSYVDCSGLPYSWTYTYTIDRTTAPAEVGGPVSNNGGVVQCIASAIAPGTLPVIQDVCGLVLSPTGPPSIGGTYTGCEGTYTYTYNYVDCSGLPFNWTYTYTIDRTTAPGEVGGPVSDNGGVVQCIASAIAPGTLPVIQDVCGMVLSPTGPPTVGGTYAGCEGTRTYTYNYVDCSGLPFSWTYTYTIDRTTPPAEVGGPVPIASTIDCPTDAVPPTLPTVQDVCGATLAMPSGPVIGGTNTGGCTGTITYTYTYTDCSGLPFVWTYTYTVDCDALTLRVLLEGAYNAGTNLMETDLNDNHVLPGQDKLLSPNIGIQLGAPFTPFGQPYNTAPWNYNGNTGLSFGDPSAPGGSMSTIPYPVDVVDWVLVTIRKNGILPANNHWTCAGWVHDDGEVTFPESCGAFSVDVMDNYYVLVQHRNHLGVLTPMPVDELCGGLTLDWDFTTQNSYAPIFRYGQVLVETMPDRWAMLKANGEQISSISAISSPDRTTWRLLQNALGYTIGDYNMDASTTSFDETEWKDNQNKTSGINFY